MKERSALVETDHLVGVLHSPRPPVANAKDGSRYFQPLSHGLSRLDQCRDRRQPSSLFFVRSQSRPCLLWSSEVLDKKMSVGEKISDKGLSSKSTQAYTVCSEI